MSSSKKVLVAGVRVTVSAWKDGRHAVIYRAPGALKRTVTVFTTEAEALACVAGLEAEFTKVPVLELEGEEKIVVERALLLAKRCGVRLDQIVEEYAAAINLLGGRSLIKAVEFFCKHVPATLKVITLAALRDEYLSVWTKRPTTLVAHRSKVAQLVRFMEGRYGVGVLASAVTREDLQAWLEAWGWSPLTQVGSRAIAGVFLKFARRRGCLPEDLPTVVERLAPIKLRRPRRANIFAVDQVELLIGHLLKNSGINKWHENALVTALLGFFAGIRPSEIARLVWEDVDFRLHRIWVSVDASKTGIERFVNIPPNLMKFLLPFRGRTGQIATLYGGTMVREAARELGLTPTPDIIRHTYGSNLLAKLGDAERVSEQMGNSRGILYSNYRNATITLALMRRYWGIVPPPSSEL